MAITQERALEVFSYKDGLLYWKSKTGPHAKVGEVAGGIGVNGYWQVKVDGIQYPVHRIIYLMHHGYMPEFIDHINGDRADSRIDNLREATRAGNNQNAAIRRDNTSGYKGVTFHKASQKWLAQISYQGKRIHIGLFDIAEDAAFAYAINAIKYHGDFARY